jgi:DnaK suppressor protein
VIATPEIYRKRLEEEQARLKEELAQLAAASEAGAGESLMEHAGYGNHQADDATEVFEQAKRLALENNLQSLLTQVEDALHRFDAGVYGLCAVCGESIEAARLEARPYATLCITCKAHQERR